MENTKFKSLIKKFLNKETISYIIFGVLTTAVDFAVAISLFHTTGLGEINSNNIAWVCAVLFAYITNKIFVFDSKSFAPKQLLKEFPPFVLARVASLIVTDLFLLFTSRVGINFTIAKLIISVVVIIMNYVFSKLFIFKKNQKGNGTSFE